MFSAAPPRSAAIALSMILRWEEDAELFEIGLAQLGQYRAVDGIVAERLGVPLPRSQSAISKDPPDLALPARLT
jgi:hypothetical protein